MQQVFTSLRLQARPAARRRSTSPTNEWAAAGHMRPLSMERTGEMCSKSRSGAEHLSLSTYSIISSYNGVLLIYILAYHTRHPNISGRSSCVQAP